MALSEKPVLFLTGGSGYIGFHVLLGALSSGYHVRMTARTEEEFTNLFTRPALQAFGVDFIKANVNFVHIPDIVAPNAYGEKLEGATHVLHAASPVPVPPIDDPERDLLQPAIIGTVNLLRAALKTPTVKRVVITSSTVANLPWPPTPGFRAGPRDRILDPQPQPDMSDLTAVYATGKSRTLNAADAFMKSHKPHFTLAHVIPGFVFGNNELATSVAELRTGSNNFILGLVSGIDFPFPRLAGAAHVDDVTKVHLKALERDDNRDWGVSTPVSHEEPWSIVQSHFPKEVEDGIFTKGSQPSFGEVWDSKETEDELGVKLMGQEQWVVDLMGQFLALKRREEEQLMKG
ncbi:MAG: hypothetical protein Q9160_003286 [Pyrenula sp. 1 TL-2023]